MGQGDDSAFKSTDCFYRGPGFNAQHPHDCSKMSITPDPEDLVGGLFCDTSKFPNNHTNT